jgi:diguanylate cyclase (GGDEF)-like protein
MRILIAEDDPASALILRKMVEAEGHSVEHAGDGKRAFAAFEAAPFDAIISDWMMPDMDGIDLCKSVRASSRGPFVYFILATTLSDKSHVSEGIAAGADDYLTKPVDRDQLRARLTVAERVTGVYMKLADQQRELEALTVRLRDEGRTDALTRLGNRLRMREDMERLPGAVARYGYRYAIALCDVDHFKQYNDTCGHMAGDEVLSRVGTLLAKICRAADSPYRYGGEEFLILLAGQTREGAIAAAERFRRAVEALGIAHPAAEGGVVTISVGVAAFEPGVEKNIDTILAEADAALYEAKRAGRNRVVAHTPT